MKKLLQALTFSLGLTASADAAEWREWSVAAGGNGHFYAVTDLAMTWSDARSEAANAGGYLTSISGIAELDFLRTTFGRSELFWTGLSTANGIGAFQWDNGEPMTFSYFGAHQPNPDQTAAVIINQPNSRGFTRGYFFETPPNQLYRGIIECNTNPNTLTPDDRTNGVPDGGSTPVMLGAALIALGLQRWRRR